MLNPKKTKFKKMHRARLKGVASRNNKLVFGEFAIQALEPCWLSSIQIETLKKTILKYTKKLGSLWIRIFPDSSRTVRSKDSRMGSGKGAVKSWVALIYPKTILFELNNISKKTALIAFSKIMYKLPIKAKIIVKK